VTVLCVPHSLDSGNPGRGESNEVRKPARGGARTSARPPNRHNARREQRHLGVGRSSFGFLCVGSGVWVFGVWGFGDLVGVWGIRAWEFVCGILGVGIGGLGVGSGVSGFEVLGVGFEVGASESRVWDLECGMEAGLG